MSQTYYPTMTGQVFVAVTDKIPANFAAVASHFAGAAEPPNPFARQDWFDETAGLHKRRNAANTDWDIVGSLSGAGAVQVIRIPLGIVNATANHPAPPFSMPFDATITRAVLVSDTTSAGSVAATTEYQWQLRNVTQSLNLFSAVVGTGTVLGGVGGGEITGNTAYPLVADQNADVDAGDAMRLEVVKVGSPTSLTNVALQLEYYARG